MYAVNMDKKTNRYSWLICFSGLLMHFCCLGMVNMAFSVYLPRLRETLQLSNTTVSLIITLRVVVSVFVMMAALRIYKKITLRIGVTFSLLSLALGMFLLSLAGSVVLCLAASFFMGIAFGLGATLPVSLLVTAWFEDRRGTALAVCTCGSGLCTMLVPPITTRLMEAYSMRTALLTEIVFILLAAAIVFLIVRDTPDRLQLAPYRFGSKEGSEKAAPEDALESEPQAKSKKKTVSSISPLRLRLIFLATFAVGFGCNSFISFLSLHFISVGYTPMAAASAMSSLGLLMIFSKLLSGFLSDRFGTTVSNYLMLGSMIAGAILSVLADGVSLPYMYLSAMFAGFGMPIGSLGIALWINDLTPADTYAKNIQKNQVIFTLGTLTGAFVPGVLADITGTYATPFGLFTLLFVLAMIIIQSMYRLQLSDR